LRKAVYFAVKRLGAGGSPERERQAGRKGDRWSAEKESD